MPKKINEGEQAAYTGVLLPYDIYLAMYKKSEAWDKLDIALIEQNLADISYLSDQTTQKVDNIEKNVDEMAEIYKKVHRQQIATIAISTSIVVITISVSAVLIYFVAQR